MTYKETIEKAWTSAGGLIQKATAAKILGVDRSVFSKRKDIKIWDIEGDEYVSYTEIMNREDIKPRKKKKNAK